MKTSLNPFENAKRTANGTGGGVSPAVIEEMQAEISILGSQNKTQAQDITDIKGSLNSINDNLTASNQTAGVTDVPFRFGCTDDGKFGYIINQGGADTVIPFKKPEVLTYKIITTDTSSSNATMQITKVDENNVTSIINVKINSSGYDDGYIRLLYDGGWKFYVYSYWMDGNTEKNTAYFAKQWTYNVNASMSFIISAKHYV